MASLRTKRRDRKIDLAVGHRRILKVKAWGWDRIGLLIACIVISFISLFFLWLTPYPRARNAESRNTDAKTVSPVVDPTSLEAPIESAPIGPALTHEFEVETVEAEIRSSIHRLLESFPHDYLALHLAGVVYTRFKQTESAEQLLRQSLELAPNDIQVRKDLAEVLRQTGRNADAEQILIQGFDRGKASPDFMHLLAESQIQLGQLEEARSTLLEAVARFPESTVNWLSLGESQLQLNDYAQAETSIRRAIALGKESEPLLYALSQALMLQNKSTEAAEVQRQLSELQQSNQLRQKSFEETYASTFMRFASSTFRSMSQIYQRHQERSTAKRWLDRAIAMDPKDVQTLSLLASHYRTDHDFERAAEASQRIVQLQPGTLSNYTNLANLRMELGDVYKAEDALRQAAQRNLGQGRAQFQLAQFLMLLKRATDAIEPARSAVQELGTIDAYLVLIQALEESGKYAQAKEELAILRRLAPDDARVQGLGKP